MLPRVFRALFVALFLLPLAACSGQYKSFDETARLTSLASAAPAPSGVKVRFFGTSSFLIEYKNTRIVTDGYFSRPPHRFFGDIEPDLPHVKRTLAHIGLPPHTDSVDAVVVMHGHYDHVMDAGLVAALTGATLYADAPTVRNARKALTHTGLDAPLKTKPLPLGQDILLGDMVMRFVEIPHSENPASAAIDALGGDPDWTYPAKIWDMTLDTSIAMHLTMGPRSILIVPSAGPIADEFYADGMTADVVMLGIGGTGWQPTPEVTAYVHNAVATTGARRVIPIHWDNHQKQIALAHPTLKAPFYECLNCALRKLRAAQTDRYDLRAAPVLAPFDPFETLPLARKVPR